MPGTVLQTFRRHHQIHAQGEQKARNGGTEKELVLPRGNRMMGIISETSQEGVIKKSPDFWMILPGL
jgi:hypothetical protein